MKIPKERDCTVPGLTGRYSDPDRLEVVNFLMIVFLLIFLAEIVFFVVDEVNP